MSKINRAESPMEMREIFDHITKEVCITLGIGIRDDLEGEEFLRDLSKRGYFLDIQKLFGDDVLVVIDVENNEFLGVFSVNFFDAGEDGEGYERVGVKVGQYPQDFINLANRTLDGWGGFPDEDV